MRYPVDNFDKWYVAQGYGTKTSYGYHEGADLNLKTGGDTDLGQPIYAIADGEVTSVHNHIGKPTFGNHIHYKCDGPWGTIYDHHAHCSEVLVKVGDKVKEGQMIAKVGKSGTDYSHDHWAIKLEPTGIDAIAKTQEDLKKWIDPILFVKKWILSVIPSESMEDKKFADEFRKLTQHNADYKTAEEILKAISKRDEAIGTLEKRIDSLLADQKNEIAKIKLDCQNEIDKAKAEWKHDLEKISLDYEEKLKNTVIKEIIKEVEPDYSTWSFSKRLGKALSILAL